MVSTLDATDLDGRLVATFDDFFLGLQTTDLDTCARNWENIQKDVLGNKDADTETTSLALGVSECMELLCDIFVNLEVEIEGAAGKTNGPLRPTANAASSTPGSSTSDVESAGQTFSPATNLLLTTYRRKHRDVGPGTNELKYSSRKDLVAAATEFFIYSRGLATPSCERNSHMRFRLLENEAQLLYRNHHNPNLHRFAGPSALALEVVGQVKQWTPELGEEARKFREQEKKNKRKRRNMEDEDEDEDNKRPRLDASPSPSPTTSTFSSFDSPSPSLSNLKRKRASSETHDPEPVSSSTKRLRTALNSSSFRSVSDPTPIPIPTHPEEQEPVTFDGFPSSMLDTWFYQTQTQGNEFGFVDPFESSDPLDPFYRYGLGALDPVVSPSSTSNAGPIPPPIQPYPLSIDLADLSVFSRSASTSSRSLTDASETEDEADGDVDTDNGDSVSIANPEVELESRVGKVQQVEAKSPLAPASLSSTGTNSVIPNFTSSFDPSASAPFDPTTLSVSQLRSRGGWFGVDGCRAGGVWPGPTPTRETFAASASS
ncbi:hypothetical protein BT96DRAFT_919432 [Gymnopus androsaceus JB14]|uniref:Uncharacterized protein n=1 Tax=Gymnopus androsaceus JB14 TaxID=1447944 RepID=A0A6A4HUH3_9AGAR|nr:hypothetical protein BT96DRAFT_919432 [Gymnopus androsaceus JB14]